MIKRRRLGPVYEKSPAQKLWAWLTDRTGKIFFTLIIWLIWIGVYRVIIGIVNFLAINMELWKEERDVSQMMRSPASVVVILVGMGLVVLYVFRDPMKRNRG